MYKQYAKENEIYSLLGIGIHTRLNDNLRISSIYRDFPVQGISSYWWETFLWDGDTVVKQYDILGSADAVVDLHLEIKLDYIAGIDVTKENNDYEF